MKPWQVTAGTTGLVAGIVGMGLAITNPGPQNYEDYAAEQLTTYLRGNICTDLPEQLQQFSEQCQFLGGTLLDTAQPQLRGVIAQNTKRENYLVFSIYRTRLSLATLVPTYEFETLGVFNQFYIYKAEQP